MVGIAEMNVRSIRDVVLFVAAITLVAWAYLFFSHSLRFGGDLTFRIMAGAWLDAAILNTVFGSYVGLAFLRTTRYKRDLQHLVKFDRLTGTLTRNYFFKAVTRDDLAGGVAVMIDIDHFKAVNDTHGHLAGDAVLAQTGQMLSHLVRRNDLVCRFGGEEFVLFLRDIGAAEAEAMADRIRLALAEEVIRIADGPRIHITASFGVAAAQPGDGVDDLLLRADRALYRAKRGGRNRVVPFDRSREALPERGLPGLSLAV